jgi:hypothetical protein
VVACWLTAAGLQVAVTFPVLADAETGIDAPALGDLAWWLGLAVVTVQAALLLRQPAAPRATLLAVAAGAPVAAALGLQAATGVTSAAVLVATFLAVLAEPPDRAWPVLAGAAALVALGEVLQQLDTGARLGTAVGGGIVQGVGTVGVAVVVGVVVRARREARLAREEQVRALLREQEALVEVAIARERTAMARELHDIAAHHLSGIAVMPARSSGRSTPTLRGPSAPSRTSGRAAGRCCATCASWSACCARTPRNHRDHGPGAVAGRHPGPGRRGAPGRWGGDAHRARAARRPSAGHPDRSHWPSCRRTAPCRKPWPTRPGTPRVPPARSSWTRATRRRSA